MRDMRRQNGADRVFTRRDRWGKTDAFLTCDVCGRRQHVNWVRARPCLFCDDSVRVARTVSRDIKHGQGESA